jgi:formylglycine-generating enzyme required for sulfatase activity
MGQRGLSANEEPVHEVHVPADFYMAETPITQQQYRIIAAHCLAELQAIEGNRGINPSQFPKNGNGNNHPVESVSWDEAGVICRWLTNSGKLPSGYHASLPPESYWEYACRAGTETRFSFGDSERDLAQHGWFNENSGGTTHPVAEKAPNPWGLYDLHGNVWEWCLDAWDPRAYSKRVDGAPALALRNEEWAERDVAPNWLSQLVAMLSRFARPGSTDEERAIQQNEHPLVQIYKSMAEQQAVSQPTWQTVVAACSRALRSSVWPADQQQTAESTLGVFSRLLKEYDAGRRVMRGGGWDYSPAICRAAYRYRGRPGSRAGNQGFRVCLLSGPPAEQSVNRSASEPGTEDAAWRDDTRKSPVHGGDAAPVDLRRSNLPSHSDGKNF